LTAPEEIVRWRGEAPASGIVPAGSGAGSAIVRALGVLEFASGSERPVSLADVVAATGLPKPTAHRLLAVLERQRLLQREPDGKRYVAGPRLSALALGVLRSMSQRGPRHTILQALVEEIGETCNFTTFDGQEVVYLDRVEAQWPLRMILQPGSRVPLHCTASGKLFLSLLPLRKRQRLIGAAPLKRFTANTLTSPDQLERALDRVRDEMVGTDNEEFLAGLSAISVPVLDSRERVCAAVAVHAPTARMNIAEARAHLPALRRAATALAATCVDD